MRVWTLVAVVMPVAIAGCSITFTRPLDPERSPYVAPGCKRDTLAPFYDVGWGVGAAAAGTWLAIRTFDDDDSDGSVGGTFVAGGIAALAATSAVIGFRRRQRCDVAHENFVRRGEVCTPLIERWRAESDPERQRKLLREMPHDCAQRATRDAK